MTRNKVKLIYLLKRYREENPNVGPKTLQQYIVALNALRRFVGKEPTTEHLTAHHISGLMHSEMDRGQSSNTINNKRSYILTIARFAEANGLIPKLPKVKKLKAPVRIPNALSQEQMERLIDACRLAPPLPMRMSSLSQSNHLRTWTALHWEILVRLIWETGHRLSALLSCPRSAVGPDRVLTMPAELTKPKREERHEISELVWRMIDCLPPHELLLPWPCSRWEIHRHYKNDILKPAGLPTTRRHLFHCLRRTSASHLVKATGSELSAMVHLGHADMRVTRNYIDPAIAYKHVAAIHVLPPLNGTEPIILPKRIAHDETSRTREAKAGE